MTDHTEPIEDAERRRRAAIEELEESWGKYAHKHEGPDPAGERSDAIRRLLTADDPYEGLTGALEEQRQRDSGNLDLAALARRRLRVLRGVNDRELDNRLCIAAADLVIEAMASRLVLETVLAAGDQELSSEAGSGPAPDSLAAAVQNLGDDDVYELLAMALRHTTHPDWADELREDLGL